MYPAFEKYVATRLPPVAAHGVCMKKHDLALHYMLEGFAAYVKAMETVHGDDAKEILRKAQQEQGYRIASIVKTDYKLGDDLDDAIDLMWMLIVPFGIRMKTTRTAPNRIREEKTQCPIHDIFKQMGVDYCNEFCLAMTTGWLQAINPRLTFQMVQNANASHHCIKEIIMNEEKP